MNKILGILHGWEKLTQALESTLVDNVAATIPWMAPIIPAWFAYENMTVVLGMPWAISLVGAAVIEFLGLASVSTTFKLWQYNNSKRKADQNAPVQVAIGTTVFYLVIVLLVNVILDTSPVEARVAKALLSMLSVAGAVVLAIRAQHARRLESNEAERQERRELRRERRACLPCRVRRPRPWVRRSRSSGESYACRAPRRPSHGRGRRCIPCRTPPGRAVR